MKYLGTKDIVKMNVIQIKKYSPNEPIGVKDHNALEIYVGQLLTIKQKDAVDLVVYIATYDKDFDQLKYRM